LARAYSVQIGVIFGVRFESRKVDKKSKPTPKHANSILETFEYFCQISSKSSTIILSYTVSKLVHFLRHSVVSVWSRWLPVIYTDCRHWKALSRCSLVEGCLVSCGCRDLFDGI